MNKPAQLKYLSMALALAIPAGLVSCNREVKVQAGANAGEPTVGVVYVKTMPLSRSLTLSSELVPFQEIDVYAKESGYVNKLLVDYGDRKRGTAAGRFGDSGAGAATATG